MVACVCQSLKMDQTGRGRAHVQSRQCASCTVDGSGRYDASDWSVLQDTRFCLPHEANKQVMKTATNDGIRSFRTQSYPPLVPLLEVYRSPNHYISASCRSTSVARPAVLRSLSALFVKVLEWTTSSLLAGSSFYCLSDLDLLH